jgi:hypothetical protein
MMRRFEEPAVEITTIEVEDILTTSDCPTQETGCTADGNCEWDGGGF